MRSGATDKQFDAVGVRWPETLRAGLFVTMFGVK